MEYIAREHLDVLKNTVKNVSNIKVGILSMMQSRLNSECKHVGHPSFSCPLYLDIYAKTREVALPMFTYAKEMVAKALKQFEISRDAILDSFPPEVSDDDAWSGMESLFEDDITEIVLSARAIQQMEL